MNKSHDTVVQLCHVTVSLLRSLELNLVLSVLQIIRARYQSCCFDALTFSSFASVVSWECWLQGRLHVADFKAFR